MMRTLPGNADSSRGPAPLAEQPGQVDDPLAGGAVAERLAKPPSAW